MPQSPDARLPQDFVVRDFISLVHKVKMQEIIKKDWNSKTNICPYILNVDTNTYADARGKAIAFWN